MRRLGVEDPGLVVGDEFVGLWIALAALPDGYRHLATHPLHVPGLDAERHLIIVEKTG